MGGDLSGDRLWRLLFGLPLFLLALTIHEYAHGWMARRLGDPTAEQEGRLTLNPLAHLDPVGTLMFVLSSLAGYGFGWARPVPVRLGNCREPLQALLRVAAAGPVSNLLQALVALLGLLLCGALGATVVDRPLVGLAPIFETAGLGTLDLLACLLGYYYQINWVLALFNLLPIPPLDGGRILVAVVPYRLAARVAALEQYGFVILFLGFRLFSVAIGAPLVWVLVQTARGLAGLGLR